MYKEGRVEHFARLNKYFIQRYERYLPTAFDESMTLLEKVNKVIEGLNTIVRHVNDQSETLEEWQTDLLSDLDTTLDEYVDELNTLKQTYQTFRDDILNDILPDSTSNILNEWLNNGTIEQMINHDIFNDIRAHLSQKPTYSEMNNAIEPKADTLYVDQQIANVVSGSPKGVYDTLTELETDLPNGDTGIYVAADSGNWYFWDGANWVAGGLYQSNEWLGLITEENEDWVVE